MLRPLALTSCAVLALAAHAAPAPAAKKKVPKTCDRLTGKAVLQTPQIKIVKRRVREIPRRVRRNAAIGGFIGKAFYGCTLPAGKVRRLGGRGTTFLYERGRRGRPRRGAIYSSSSASFADPAGTFVLAAYQDGVENRGTYLTGAVENLATGKSYAFWSFDPELSYEEGGMARDEPARVLLSDRGTLAAIFDDSISGARSVRGFDAAGTESVLDTVPGERRDDIPLDSLAFDGTTVSWTNAGEPRSAGVSAAAR